MKKRIFLLTFLPFLLSACKFELSDASYSEGFLNNDQTSASSETIESFEGDVIETEGMNKSILTMNPSSEQKELTVEDKEAFSKIITDESKILKEVTVSQNVGSDKNGLKVGHVMPKINGELTLQFIDTFSYNAVEIICVPRSAVIGTLEGSKEEIDTDIAISVNGSKYVNLKTDFETIEAIEPSTCSFNLDVASNVLALKVLGQRAVIKEIKLYSDPAK